MNNQSQETVLQVSNLSKAFGKKTVLNGVHLDLPRGKIYGITGKNGSGKSVLLRTLSGLVQPDKGEIKWFGQKLGEAFEFPPQTGILIDSPGFLRGKSALNNLEILAKISQKADSARIREVLTICRLDPADSRPVRTFSSGMLQRLYLAQALLEDPEILLLDEPTNTLDVDGQREIYAYLVELNAQGKTILLTSNYPDELKILCDQVFRLTEGKLIPYQFSETGVYQAEE